MKSGHTVEVKQIGYSARIASQYRPSLKIHKRFLAVEARTAFLHAPNTSFAWEAGGNGPIFPVGRQVWPIGSSCSRCRANLMDDSASRFVFAATTIEPSGPRLLPAIASYFSSTGYPARRVARAIRWAEIGAVSRKNNTAADGARRDVERRFVHGHREQAEADPSAPRFDAACMRLSASGKRQHADRPDQREQRADQQAESAEGVEDGTQGWHPSRRAVAVRQRRRRVAGAVRASARTARRRLW